MRTTAQVRPLLRNSQHAQQHCHVIVNRTMENGQRRPTACAVSRAIRRTPHPASAGAPDSSAARRPPRPAAPAPPPPAAPGRSYSMSRTEQVNERRPHWVTAGASNLTFARRRTVKPSHGPANLHTQSCRSKSWRICTPRRRHATTYIQSRVASLPVVRVTLLRFRHHFLLSVASERRLRVKTTFAQ